jgi:serine/threonine protein kinase
MHAVALKVLAHGASRHELEVMQRIGNQALAAQHLVQVLDHFEYEDPNGTHLCLVMELMWQDVQGFMEGYRDSNAEVRFPVAKRIAYQVIKSSNFLQKSGVIHNGFVSCETKLIPRFTPEKLSHQIFLGASDRRTSPGQR